MDYPFSIQNLMNQFSKFPSVGPKTAERYVFYLLKKNQQQLQDLAQSISELKKGITICQKCLSISNTNPCLICSDLKRNQNIICIVANTQEMMVIEAIKQYNGLYYILGGMINAIQNINPEQLNIQQLINKIKQNNIQEIILALNPTLEGETTSMYLIKLLKPFKIKITRLAKGLPMGADLEYADEITLMNALKYRNVV